MTKSDDKQTLSQPGTIKALRELYGMSKNSDQRQVVNRAIRETIPGGNECLDALDHFAKLHRSLQSERRANVANMQQMVDLVGVTLDRLHEIRDAMAVAVLSGGRRGNMD